MNSKVAILVFLILAVLHHDVWNWDDKSLWFGFIPVGLGYHAVFSLVVALFWALVIRFAWPHRVEAWAELGESAGEAK